MGRGMLLNIAKKTTADIVSIYDVNHNNIEDFMNSITEKDQEKIR
jgi:hypothetical protein